MRVVGIDPRSMVARLSSTSRTAKRHDCSTQLTCRLWGSAQRNELTCWHCAIGSGRINPTMLPSNGRKRCPTGLELLIQVRPCRWHSRSSHHLPRNPRDICRARGLETKASIARPRSARQIALQLFPGAHHLFARRKDHGRAEAALIALTGHIQRD